MAVKSVPSSNSTPLFTGLSTDSKPTSGVLALSRFIETDTDDEYEFDGNSWLQTKSEGSSRIYGMARNMVVQAAGTYNSTDVLGFVCTAPGTGDWSITPIDGTAVTGIDPATFAAGGVYPIHATSITVGTAGEALLFIP